MVLGRQFLGAAETKFRLGRIADRPKAGLGGEAEETALFLPVMQQVFAQSQQPGRR
jgi:hypothetical protein